MTFPRALGRVLAAVVSVAIPATAAVALASPASAAIKYAKPVNWGAMPGADNSGHHDNATVATLNWSTGAGVNNNQCFLDGVKVACDHGGNTSSYSLVTPALGVGQHVFAVRTFGSGRPTVSRWEWTIDTTAPDAPTITPPTSPTRARSAAIYFTDATTDVVGFTCKLDSQAAADCTSPWRTASDQVLDLGSHTLTVTAHDAAHNSAAASVTWDVEADAPDYPVIVDGPANPSNNPNPQITFHSEITGTTYQCSLDGPSASDCTSPTALTNLSEGQHSFTVAGTPPGGSTPWATTIDWRVDLTAPPGPWLVTGPPAVTDDTTPTVVVADDEQGVTYRCELVDVTTGATVQAAASCADSIYLDLDPNTPDGEMLELRVSAVDAAGNVSAAPLLVDWTMNQTQHPYAAQWLSPTPAYVTTNAPTFRYVAPDAGTAGGATGFLCSMDGAAFAACGAPDSVGAGSYAVQTPLSQGKHAFRVETTNGTSASSPLGYTFVVDTVAPPAPQVTVNGSTVTFTDADGSVVYRCSVDGGAYVACTSPWTPPAGLANGDHTISVEAVDAAANVSGPQSATFTVGAGTGTSPGTGTGTGTGTGSETGTGAGSGSGTGTGTGTPSTAADGGQADTTAPTVASVTAPATLPGSAVATFSETVTGLTSGSVRLVTASTSKTVKTTVTALNGSTVVPPAGQFTSVRVTPMTSLVLGQTYSLVVDAAATHDTAGNASVARTVTFRAARTVEETHSVVSAAWQKVNTKSAFGGSYVREHLTGATARWTFTGTAVTWWTVTGPAQGKAAVYVDGARKAVVNNYSATSKYHVARLVKGLKKGQHTVLIKVLGVKGAKAAKGTFVAVDAFTVGKTRTSTPALTMVFRLLSVSRFSASHAWSADLKGETATVTFRGTTINWWTMRSRTQGKAAVYVDGVLKATYDNYAATTAYSVKRSVTKLSDKVHTLKIVVLGSHRKAAKGSLVTVDRFTVA